MALFAGLGLGVGGALAMEMLKPGFTNSREVEDALNSHPAVSESAVIGVPDEIKGTALVCFVVLKSGAGSLAPPTQAAHHRPRTHAGGCGAAS